MIAQPIVRDTLVADMILIPAGAFLMGGDARPACGGAQRPRAFVDPPVERGAAGSRERATARPVIR